MLYFFEFGENISKEGSYPTVELLDGELEKIVVGPICKYNIIVECTFFSKQLLVKYYLCCFKEKLELDLWIAKKNLTQLLHLLPTFNT